MMKHLLSYLISIFLFNLLFVLTMTVDNEYLYLGLGNSLNEVVSNNKVPIQREIFIYGVAIVLFAINFYEKRTINTGLKIRFIKTALTVSFIYVINWLVFLILNIDVFCIYYHATGIPAFGFYVAVITILSVFLFALEALSQKSSD